MTMIDENYDPTSGKYVSSMGCALAGLPPSWFSSSNRNTILFFVLRWPVGKIRFPSGKLVDGVELDFGWYCVSTWQIKVELEADRWVIGLGFFLQVCISYYSCLKGITNCIVITNHTHEIQGPVITKHYEQLVHAEQSSEMESFHEHKG